MTKAKWERRSAYEVGQMTYAERIAYEAGRRAAMAADGVTEAQLNESPAAMTRRLLGKL